MTRIRVPKIVQLAERVEADIRKRNLRPGDPYLNAAGLGKKLRISPSTANRVLQILDQRGIVERARKKGTLVGHLTPGRPVRTIHRVHMLTFQSSVRPPGIMADPVIVGIQHKLPGSMVQFNFLSSAAESDFLGRLLEEARRSPEPVGIVLTRAPFAAQRSVEESGIPTVVHGYLQPSVRALGWITIDYEEIGAILGRYVQERKARRLVLIIPEQPLLPGDYHLLDRLRAELARQGRGVKDLLIACLPPDDEAVCAWLTEHVPLKEGRTVVACYRDYHVPGVRKALTRARVRGSSRSIVVIDDHPALTRNGQEGLPRIVSTVPDFDVGVSIAELLLEQVKPGKRKTSHRVFGVRMEG